MEDTENCQNVHFPNAMCFQNNQRGKAKEALDANKETEKAFYHLVESHAPYHRVVINALEKEEYEKLGQLDFSCSESKIRDNINSLKQRMKALPKEWTIVHLTPFANITECYNFFPNKYYTNPLFVSVFTGGQDVEDVIVQTIKAPTDKSGNHINLHKVFEELLQSFKTLLHKRTWNDLPYVQNRSLNSYQEVRMYLDEQLKLFNNQLSADYLQEWKCLLMSSFQNETNNILISTKLEEFLHNHKMQDLSKRNKEVLKYIFRSASHLSSIELRRALNETCKPFKLNSSFYSEFRNWSNNLNCHDLPRNPLILILDEKMEVFPWEMMPILQGAPVTRMPSLHFAHSLHAHYKHRMVGGYLTGINFDNGSYLINPGLDLRSMQQRMSSFMDYWMPQWEGIVGRKPTDEEFKGLLQKSDIFVYNGHGDGCQFISGDTIKYLHIKSVVFLLGCSSIRYRSTGSLCAMYSTFLHYLSACCPCLVGMLYDVGDKDCDYLATGLLSLWIPSKAPKEWLDIDQKGWLSCRTKNIEFLPSKDREVSDVSDEPNLLLALAKAKQNDKSSQFTRSAIVARGLPIKY